MKKTLLQIVQDMVTVIDSEAVTDVAQTEESIMCVNLANQAYENMMVNKHWRHLRSLVNLVASTNKHELDFPTGTYSFDPLSLWYDEEEVFWKEPNDFTAFTITRNVTESNIELVDKTKVYNDRKPEFFTSYDDETLTFDAIPSSVSGLDASDSLAVVWRLPTSALTANGEFFDLPIVAFPALIMACNSMATGTLKGDSQEAARLDRKYIKMLGSLARNAQLVDVKQDLRSHIIARPTRLAQQTHTIVL